MDAKTFIATTSARLDALNENRPKELLIIATEMKTQVQFRIQTTGTSYTGATFYGYSPAYAKTRKERGRQTAIVDFTFTGQMWNNIRAVIIENTKTTTTVEVGAQTQDNRLKLIGALNHPRIAPRGAIITPNKEEIALGAEANRLRIEKYLQG